MRKRNVVIGVVVAVVVLGAWGSILGAGSDGSRGGSFGAATGAGTPAAIPSATPVVVPTPDPVVADPSATPAPTYTLPGYDPSWTPPPVEPPTEFEMPDLRGKDLDDVEEALEALGAQHVRTTDVTGEGRSVWVSSNWKVCTQDPRKGRDVTGDDSIRLGVVKSSERCP